jgi:hypothetical protein
MLRIDTQEKELCKIAAFRLREAANRIDFLANGARSPELRALFVTIYEKLMGDQQELSKLADKPDH